MGPLDGLKVVEIAGIGPGPFCGMLLADMGALVLRVARPGASDTGIDMPARYNLMNRSRPSLAVDLKTRKGVDFVLRLCEGADVLFEGFRPGVMEKLGLGPAECMARNASLVYGRMTGYGQDGPLADTAGHDTDYIALAGALHAIGPKDRPPAVPLNLIGDFGGGGAYLAIGILAAVYEARNSGKGQVVDAAMLDGVLSMMTMYYGLMACGLWRDERESNVLDGAAPFVNTYRTRDGRYFAVCAIEARFYEALLDALEITDIDPADQYTESAWPEHRARFAEAFGTKPRDAWCLIFDGADACAAPVLSLREVPEHEHARARKNFVDVDGIRQPGPAPRFSRTGSEIRHGPAEPGDFDRTVLADFGLGDDEIAAFFDTGT